MSKKGLENRMKIAVDWCGRLGLNRQNLIANKHLREISGMNFSHSSIDAIVKPLENWAAASSEAAVVLILILQLSWNEQRISGKEKLRAFWQKIWEF